MDRKELQKKWLKDIKKLLVGKKIVDIDYLTEKELDEIGWSRSAAVFTLNDGQIIYASQDDEGNGPGAIFTSYEKLPIIPVI